MPIGLLAAVAAPELASAALSSADDRIVLAYLDPGTGSFIIQTLVALVAGVAVTLRLYWARIKAFFRRAPPEVEADDEE
ncbi:MAG: hypothetical protein QNK03_07490 [Myxococcota bacterium]|nr:hypothetical protein [Myxococcota bacterium]